NDRLSSDPVPVTADPHEVVFTWRERTTAEENSWQPTLRASLEIHNPSGMPRLEQAQIEGPYNVAGVSEHTATRDRILVCRPDAPEQEEACARDIMTELARRAFRRPVTEADISAP